MRIQYLSAVSLIALGFAGAAVAQDVTPSIVIQEQAPPPTAYSFGNGGDSGVSRVTRDGVERRKPGSGDVLQVLKAMPGVQFSRSEGLATEKELLDLRPADISISGGNIYENMIRLDGVGVNSRLDVSSTNANHYIEGNAAASAQSVWVDADLIDSVAVYDSNISAQFGQFTGGVVELETRRPSPVFGVSTYYGVTRPGLAQFRMSDRVRDSFKGDYPDEPEYEKERFSLIVDLPVSERLRALTSYTRNESSIVKDRGANWRQYGTYGQSSLQETYLLKGEYDLADDLLLTGQVTYSPYETEFAHQNGYDNLTFLNGGGLTTKLGLEGRRGDAEWELDLSYVSSDTDRTSENPGTTSVSTVGTGVDWCSSNSSCAVGGPGNLIQRQKDLTLKGLWKQPLTNGDLRLGFEIAQVTGRKAQPYSRSYRHGDSAASEVGANIACADPAEAAALTCVPGRWALGQFNETRAFDTERRLETYTLWGEYRFDLGGFDVRAGLRYDYETLLENHNFAPRLSASHALPWEGHSVTVAANRYYGRSFLGYALREDYPGNYIWRRTPTMVNGQKVFGDNWTLYSHTETAGYSNADLATPYVDELSFAVTGPVPLIGGEYRFKGVARDSEDQFSRSGSTSEVYDKETGGNATRQRFTINNDGSREYRGLSMEYMRRLADNHALSLTANWSKTKASNISYFDVTDETDYQGDLVLYRGEIVSALQALADNQIQDFATPWTLNADLSSNWFDGRVKTNLNIHWNGSFERVEDTGINQTVNGTRYDVYDVVKYDSSMDANLSVTAEIARTRFGTAELDVRINNLFNTIPVANATSTSDPWQMGRNAWVGLRVRY
ncbi:hypothetical protein WEU32_12575 [Brevundimonas sp. BH3]|uniref:hypothetical protein n=1 Tax=Brevundimonas sp. BH3 TaxID=3133089 RepID=UPI00324BBDDA